MEMGHAVREPQSLKDFNPPTPPANNGVVHRRVRPGAAVVNASAIFLN